MPLAVFRAMPKDSELDLQLLAYAARHASGHISRRRLVADLGHQGPTSVARVLDCTMRSVPSNNKFEADPVALWPHRARSGLRARRCADASWRAAQHSVTI